MKRTVGDNKNPRPVERVEVSDKNVKLRIILFVVFIVIAVASFIIAFVKCNSIERGWQTIDGGSNIENSCAGDFTLSYYIDDDMDKSQVAELNNYYAELCKSAYSLFDVNASVVSGNANLSYINGNPNSNAVLDAELYSALKKVDELGDRYLYRAPVFAFYQSMFYCTDDSAAEQFDPRRNGELAALIDRYVEFTSSEEHIRFDFKPDNIIELYVSDEYSEFAKEQKQTAFVDLFWFKNAFIADYVANGLIDRGFTNGILSSKNGFSRCLDDGARGMNINIYDRTNDGDVIAGHLRFDGRMSSVSFNDRPKGRRFGYFYVYGDGTCITPFVGADGYNETTMPSYLAYSSTVGCGDLATAGYKVFTADSWNGDKISSLKTSGIYSVFCADGAINYNENGANITPNTSEYAYTAAYIE